MTSVWPLPVSAKNVMPERDPVTALVPVQLTVHSIVDIPYTKKLIRKICEYC
jgi:hypothetical protein